MLARLGKTIWRTQRRRIVSAVVLFAHVLGTIGVPMPVSSAHSASGPCGRAASACCCGTAEQCRASRCGCPHSPALTPDATCAIAEDVPSCCAAKAAPPAEPKSCCAQPTTPDAKPREPSKPQRESDPDKVRWVIGISAQKCRGGTFAEAGETAPLWIVAPFTLRQYWPLCASIADIQQYPFSIAAEHLDPPPRSLAS